MECNRLEKLIKSWYFQVQDEAMAPARMVSFMKKHVSDCPICLADPLVRQEVDKITEIVLPPSKMKKLTDSEEKEKSPKKDPSAAVVEEETVSSDEDPEENDDDNDDDDDDDESEIEVDLEI